MISIDLDKVEDALPADWEERAQAALDLVAEIRDPAERAAAINKRSKLWGELKDILSELSHHKCWYCESRENRSDNAVDHYRPKNRVAESVSEEGYWWLAFNWRNYRYSCTFCNSLRKDKQTGQTGGKQDHFPLFNEEKRVTDREGDLDEESPLLIDPSRALEPGMLCFDDDGRAAPESTAEEDKLAYECAKTSIERYNLNHSDLVETRFELARDIRKLVRQIDGYLIKARKGDGPARSTASLLTQTLCSLLGPKAEYSAAARSILKGLNGTYSWIRKLGV